MSQFTERNFRSGKCDKMSQRFAQIKNDIVLKQSRLIDKKYGEVMKKSPFNQQKMFLVNDVSFNCHPIYDLYAASKCGKIIHIKRQKPIVGNLTNG